MSKVKVFMLITNENCNLNCTYCYEHHKSNSFMSFDIAKNIIDNELKNALSTETYEIEFLAENHSLIFL